jgi:hypothetical protein
MKQLFNQESVKRSPSISGVVGGGSILQQLVADSSLLIARNSQLKATYVMKKTIISLLAALMVCASSQAQVSAQDSVSFRAFQEIVSSLNKVYSAGPVSFTATYIHERSDSSGVRTDTLTGQYKINGNKYWLLLDGVEQVQDDTLNVSVYPYDSSIYVNAALPMHGKVLSIDMFDELFTQMQVSHYTMIDSAGLKKINIQFQPNSLYQYYTFCIGATTKDPVQVSYKVGIAPYSLTPTSPLINPPYDKYTINFAGIQYTAFSQDIFSTGRVIKLKNGGYEPQAAYSGYGLVDQVTER